MRPKPLIASAGPVGPRCIAFLRRVRAGGPRYRLLNRHEFCAGKAA